MKIVCIASGPSLTKEDVDYVRGKAKVYVCNDGYILAPWADVLYAADYDWWAYHYERLSGFKGEKLTCDFNASKKYGLKYIPVRKDIKWGTRGILASGHNSGFQILNLAGLHNPEKIILLGYDMMVSDKSHWFGDHPKTLKRGSPYQKFIQAFNDAAPLIKTKIINASRETALTCFERKTIEEALSD